MEEHPGSWYNALPIPEWAHGFINATTYANWTVILVLVLLVLLGTRRMTPVPRGWQNFWEWVTQVFRGFAVSVMGPEGEKHVVLLATSFIYIFCLNVFGLIPGCLSPTASLNMTVALALVIFCAVHYYGFKAHGWRYLGHFANPLHIISELAKPVSLSLRLFGNIFGEDTVVAELSKLAAQVLHAIYIPVPFHLVMVAFALFGGFIQALIFTMLSAVYISLATAHEGHGTQEAHAEASEPAAEMPSSA
ncbi:MAG: F0F1 ATP synthase subunit A [Armatimonadetes bacterium]|nr:F0F1 ATP synthase subunit A [Armatimonadota bacterium]